MLTLYDFSPSPHCVRVRLALALARLPYRRVGMTLEGDQRRPAFRALSPLGTVPVLVDGAIAIPESYAALIWLAERTPALLPGSRARRAEALMWLAASATVLDPPIRRAYDEAFFTSRPSRPALDSAFAEVRQALDRIEGAIARAPSRRYLTGSTPTVADAAAAPSLWLLADLVQDYPKRLPTRRWPTLSAWYARLCARPEVAEVLAQAER